MEYTNKESLLKRFWNKIKDSALGSLFSSSVDVPSDNELYERITSEEGLSIKEAKEIELAFEKASSLLNFDNDYSNESKFKVTGINPKAPVSHLSRAKDGRT